MNREEISKAAWTAKAIAILFVIIAHTPFTKIENLWLRMFIDRLGAMGVPIFLSVSGYFYHPEKYTSRLTMMRHKIKGLFFPWMFCGTIIYIYTTWRQKAALDFTACLFFLVGKGSYLYYLTVLVLVELLFFGIRQKNSKKIVIVTVVVSFLSSVFTAYGISDSVIQALHITNYLNPLNWIGFFAIGFYCQIIDLKCIFSRRITIHGFLVALWIFLFVAGYYVENSTYGYFSKLGFIMEWISTFLLLQVAWWLRNKPQIVELGKYSYSLYLIHIQIIPIVCIFAKRSGILQLFVPAITYIVTVLAINIMLWIGAKLHIQGYIKNLIGLRR